MLLFIFLGTWKNIILMLILVLILILKLEQQFIGHINGKYQTNKY